MATQVLRVPHVVVVGGGFGGLAAARALRRAPVTVTVLDRRNHHVFQPLLYQVATAALSPAEIAAPIRGVLRRQRDTEVRLAEVVNVDLAAKQVILADGGRVEYDYLIVSTGATHAYFGHPEWELLAPGLKTLEDATEIRRRFLLAFEAAEQEEDPAERAALLTFVVIGAGPTGVEMAGAMAEIARHSLVRDFRHIDPTHARILLVEGGPRILPAYHPDLSAYAERALRRIGVAVLTESLVERIEPGGVWIGGECVRTRNVVWAAGVTASPLGARLGVPVDRVGRVQVEPDLSIPGHPEVFVIGDLAALADEDGKLLPGVAPVAQQQGRHAVKNLVRTIRGEARRPFRYFDKGSMATIGRWAAIMETAGVRLRGWLAWLAWLFIHILALIGFRNRAVVMLQWAWSYLTWQRGARLITGDPHPDAAAHATGKSPADAEQKGWMSADRDQAAAAPGNRQDSATLSADGG